MDGQLSVCEIVAKDNRDNQPQPEWPAIPTIELADKDKTGDMMPMQKMGLLIMQFIIWQELCARSFADTCKDIEELIRETLWNWAFYEQMAQGAWRAEVREVE